MSPIVNRKIKRIKDDTKRDTAKPDNQQNWRHRRQVVGDHQNSCHQQYNCQQHCHLFDLTVVDIFHFLRLKRPH